jgi:hypothetical protein
LQEIDIGVILGVEQIDVRRFLLADSPFAPSSGARTPLQTGNALMPNSFSSLTEDCELTTENS